MSRTELVEAMAELGKRPTEEEMDKFMSEFDLDGSGTIELVSKFCATCGVSCILSAE